MYTMVQQSWYYDDNLYLLRQESCLHALHTVGFAVCISGSSKVCTNSQYITPHVKCLYSLLSCKQAVLAMHKVNPLPAIATFIEGGVCRKSESGDGRRHSDLSLES